MPLDRHTSVYGHAGRTRYYAIAVCQRMSPRRAQTSAYTTSGRCGSRWSGVMGQVRTPAMHKTDHLSDRVPAQPESR